MISSIALSFILSGTKLFDPPKPSHAQLQQLAEFDIERFDRDLVERGRQMLAYREDMIKETEMELMEPGFFTPAEAHQIRERLEKERVDVIYLKRLVQELEIWQEEWALNPGREADRVASRRVTALLKEWDAAKKARRRCPIAPPPRELKRK